MRRAWMVMIVLVVGCKAEISGAGLGGDSSDGTAVDAPATGIDATGSNTPTDATVVAPDGPRCSARSVVLKFDGVTLTKGPSDAKTLTASWIGVTDGATTATVPPFLATDGNRLALIAAVTDRIRTGLAQFPIQVLTAPPATGNYVLIAFGGQATALGTPYTYATNELDCGDVRPNDLAWVSDVVPFDKIDDYAIGAIGYGLGLTGTTDPGDCMCGWGTQCNQPTTTQCTLATTATAEVQCAGQVNPQREVAAFETAFCTP